jgi:geranylgeranyl diphosphate synthase type II
MDPHDLVVVAGRRLPRVDEVLDGWFEVAAARAGRFGSRYVHIIESLRHNTAGGKRFRPRMVLAAYESLGGTDIDVAARVAAAYELLHTALIVHDDVIDRDFVRRGRPNVSGSYRDRATTAGISLPLAEHRGMSVAVVAGDLALAGAYRLVDESGADELTRGRLIELLDDAVSAAAAGEYTDVDFSLHVEMPSVDDVVEMERLKTAWYSFEAPLQAGAVLAGASLPTIDALGAFGRNIGIAYQIVDDVLGVFGEEDVTGKSSIGDLREGKRTVLIAHAATQPEWAAVRTLFGDPGLDDDGAARLRDAITASGARAFAELLAADYANRAWEALAEDAVPASTREELAPVVRAVLERTR